MNKLTVINDLHLGVKRQTGTTMESREALEKWTLSQFAKLLLHIDTDLCILGDLFDGYSVSKRVEIRAFLLLRQWLGDHPGRRLFMVAGNHDLSRDSRNLSSFENLCEYLSHDSEQVTKVIGRTSLIAQGVAAVSHMPNQTLFDGEIENLLQQDGLKFVLLHCNYDNHFAAQADHSLNISAETAEKFAAKGVQLVFAHEHQQRDLGNVRVIGNQFPTSVADCLGNDSKRFAVIDGEELCYTKWLPIAEVYTETDWQSEDLPTTPFIRVSGTAAFEQAAEVVQRLADLRQMSSAFVITNAVRIEDLQTETSDVSLETCDVVRLVEGELPEGLRERFKEVVGFRKDS